MKTLDPRAKLLCIFLCTSLALVYKDAWSMAGLCAFTLLSAQVLGGDLISFYKKLRHLVTLLLSITVLQILFVRTGTPLVVIGRFTLVSWDGLLRGILAVLRYAIILASASVMAGENSRKVIQSLIQCGMPYTFAFMLQIALRFMPLFSQSFSDAMSAIQLRGVELREVPMKKRIGLYAHLLLPVIADAIIKSQDLATTMQARGFGAYKRRTSYLHIRLKAADWVAMAVLVALFAAALALYIRP